jgi:hypothetical protein
MATLPLKDFAECKMGLAKANILQSHFATSLKWAHHRSE